MTGERRVSLPARKRPPESPTSLGADSETFSERSYVSLFLYNGFGEFPV